ncbi:hypothetical protein BJ166DRAFT_67295 [Pestalotiopsis sp. NC0098]|nr:hypothetical protein BJ166DRAFT_67295 [Pestalotiopsis sp. NC0098]
MLDCGMGCWIVAWDVGWMGIGGWETGSRDECLALSCQKNFQLDDLRLDSSSMLFFPSRSLFSWLRLSVSVWALTTSASVYCRYVSYIRRLGRYRLSSFLLLAFFGCLNCLIAWLAAPFRTRPSPHNTFFGSGYPLTHPPTPRLQHPCPYLYTHPTHHTDPA